MTLLYPGFLQMGMFAAVIVVLGQLRHARRRRRLGDFLGGPRGAGRLSPASLYRLERERILCLAIVALCMGLSAAEPRRVLGPESAPQDSAPGAVVFALDVSASMQAADVAPTRLARAVTIAREFLEQGEGTRVGLTLFAGKGYTMAPPTEDLSVLGFLLDGVVPTTVSVQDPGSLLSAGIRHASGLLPVELGTAERAIVLLTDGEAGEADAEVIAAVREASDAGITIHALGIGTPRGGEMSLPGGAADAGGPIVDRTGNVGISRLQEPLLRDVAQAGGGEYAEGGNGAEVRRIYRAVRSPPDPTTQGPLVAGFDLTLLLIGASLLLILADGLIDVWTRPGRPTWMRGMIGWDG